MDISPLQKKMKGEKNYSTYKVNDIRKARLEGKKCYCNNKGKIVQAKFLETTCSCKAKCLQKLNQAEKENQFEKNRGFHSQYEKDLYVRSHIEAGRVAHRQENAQKPREFTFKYFITTNGVRSYVCKTAFYMLFDVTEGQVKRLQKLVVLNMTPQGQRWKKQKSHVRRCDRKIPPTFDYVTEDKEEILGKLKVANSIIKTLTSLPKNISNELLIKNPVGQSTNATESKKHAARTAHIPKPTKAVKPTTVQQPLLGHITKSDRRTSENDVMNNLMQELVMAKSPEELKKMAFSSFSNNDLLLNRLTAIHRSEMSEAMRKLAEHKLDFADKESPKLLAELEKLVQPEMAVDVYNMPLEMVQSLQKLFNDSAVFDVAVDVPMDIVKNEPYAYYEHEHCLPQDCQPEIQKQEQCNVDLQLLQEASIASLDSDRHEKETQTAITTCREMTTQTEYIYCLKQRTKDCKDVKDSRPEHLLLELHELIDVMKSSAPHSAISNILISTAVNSISSLIHEFTQQFTNLQSQMSTESFD